MNTPKVYIDSGGEELTIFQMVRCYPLWAERKIQEGEAAQRRIAALEGERDRLREALSFYADSDRYHGPNRRRDDATNQYGHDNCPYVWDVTRDGGAIARAD